MKKKSTTKTTATKKAPAKKAAAKAKPAKKAAAKKAATKKVAAKKAAPKKAAMKKVVAKKAATKKAPAKKTAGKKAATKKVVAKKTTAIKATAKKAASKKAVTPKKSSRSRPAAAKVARPKRGSAVLASEGTNIVATSLAAPLVTLSIGDDAPAVVLPGIGKNAMVETIDLGHFVGRQPVVLYFYPKDDTPGCTKEACDIRDSWTRLQDLNVAVFGVSPDDVESHVRFAQKFELPYALLADTANQAANAYGVWVEKNMYGRKYFGIQRATFLVNKQGKIAAVWPKVSVEGHIDEIIAAIERL